MNILKSIGLGAAMVTTGAMLMGTPTVPKLNTTPSHINFYTGIDYSKEPEYYEKSRIYNSKDLNCSKAVKRYVDTALSEGNCKVYDYTKEQKYLGYNSVEIRGISTSKSVVLITDDLAHPTFKTYVYDYNMSETDFKKNFTSYTKLGNYYTHTDISNDGVWTYNYFYPGESYFVVHTSYPDGRVLPDSSSCLKEIRINATK
ncbi:MAG: hypothetical protein J5684_03400 [Eubacterium sp.]|nr:hypothetical protein [Eubacterium sp.]